jgi:5'-methylthioadenosine phosphorylase
MKIGIIGGSGLDDPDILEGSRDLRATTPWGDPSSPLKEGRIGGREVVLLARHGREHTIPPTQVNYRANIRALKDAGVDRILATTAVGSLREDIRRGDFVVLDQFIDFTRLRPLSFHSSFEPHRPVHAAMAEPYDERLRSALIDAATRLGLRCHPRGTVVTIEGPRFSTRAESRMFRLWGADVINMSIATETILAVEASIPYAAVAMSTDYDSWKDDEEAVSWEAVLSVFEGNARKMTELLRGAVGNMA